MKKSDTKTYSRRDSATKVLKKMGVPIEKYDDYIEKTETGVVCKIGLANHDYLPSGNEKSSHVRNQKVKKSPGVFNTHEEACTYLLSKGIPKDLHDLYINHMTNGQFGVTVHDNPKNIVVENIDKSDKNKPVVKAKSVSGRCRELILEGYTNKEVWAAIKEEFELDENKKYYPAWNRGKLKREGLIS